jgi:hypothetical protein
LRPEIGDRVRDAALNRICRLRNSKYKQIWRCQQDAGAGSSGRFLFQGSDMSLRKFVIEREIPKIGTAGRDQLRAAAAKSNGVLRELGPDIQWVESYVTDDKIFCVYLASNEGMIRQHAEMSGFPASKISEVRKTIDPTTERPE